MTNRNELIQQAEQAIKAAIDDPTAPPTIVAWKAANAIVDARWTPPPSGDAVLPQVQRILRSRMESLGLVQEIEGDDGAEFHNGDRVHVEAAEILTRYLADAGLLRASECTHDATWRTKHPGMPIAGNNPWICTGCKQPVHLDDDGRAVLGAPLPKQDAEPTYYLPGDLENRFREYVKAVIYGGLDERLRLAWQQFERVVTAFPAGEANEGDNAAIVGAHVVDILDGGQLGIDCVVCGQRTIPHPGPCPGERRGGTP